MYIHKQYPYACRHIYRYDIYIFICTYTHDILAYKYTAECVSLKSTKCDIVGVNSLKKYVHTEFD